MKSIGIVRKIDDLGRIVLPKELRSTNNIYSGDDFEIYVEDDKIILEKYSKLYSKQDKLKEIFVIKGFYLIINNVIINNGEPISEKLVSIIQERKKMILHSDLKISKSLLLKEGSKIYPIVKDSNIVATFVCEPNINIEDILKILNELLENM